MRYHGRAVDPLAELVGDSPSMVALRRQVQQLVRSAAVASRPPSILILGETGSGKGLLARCVHRAGPRARGPFIDVNCAAIPEKLLEAELFGYERGAFTDARQAKPGLFQLAHRGVLFLDEIGLLDPQLQAKLLSALEQRAVRRLGATRSEPADVWIVAATNEDLREAVQAHRFRQDLYHRLAVITLQLPPMRERGPDILLLAEHFLARACEDYGLPPKTFSADARAAMLVYGWPGNVRELGNVLERAVLLSDASVVTAAALSLPTRDAVATPRSAAAPPAPAELLPWRDRMRDHLLTTLTQTGWNISQTAAALGISRNTVRARIARFSLKPGASPPLASGPPRIQRRPAREAGPRALAPPPPPVAEPRGSGTIAPARPSVRSESRHLGFLRIDLVPGAGPEGLSDTGRALDELLDKIQSFGGRIEELGRSSVIAAFGVEQPVEDAAIRAALAGLAAQRMASEGRAGDRVHALRCSVHAAGVATRQAGSITFVDAADKQAALYALEGLMPALGTIAVSDDAAPLLRRRFSLVPLTATSVAAPRAYRVSGFESTRFRCAGGIADFVGRVAERRLLEERLDLAMSGEGQVVAIVGEPGIGKSRLLYEFRQGVPAGEVTYLEGQCVSHGVGTPLLPIIDLVRSACGLGEADPPDIVADKVTRTLEELGLDPEDRRPFFLHLLGAPAGERLASLSPEAVSARTLESLLQMSLSASNRRPLVLAIEDLHWIDRASEAYLFSLAAQVAKARILLIVTYRSAERPAFAATAQPAEIALPPLSADEAQSIARAVLGGADDGAASLIAARADGNPLFVEELTLAVAEGGADPPSGSMAAGEAATLPVTLQGLLSSRLERLGTAKTIAELAATIGQTFSLAMLEAVAETDALSLSEALDRLAEAEVIVPEAAPGADYRFRHALIRDAAYQGQSLALRRRAHARVARALETTFPEQAATQPELVAHHLTEAGQDRAAIGWWVRGGTRARQRAAYADAIEQLRRALDLLPAALPPGPERDRIELEIRVSLGISLQGRLGFAAPEVGQVHARARELCRTVEGGPLLLGALGGLFLYDLFRSDLVAAREMAQQHLLVTETIGARNRLCASYSALGYTAFQGGAPEEARGHFERSIELVDTYPRPDGTALTPNNIGVASESMLALTLCVLGHVEAAVAASARALARADRCPPGERAFSTAYAWTCASRLHLLREEPLEARHAAQEAIRIGREHGFALHVGTGALADCAARIALGEPATDDLAAALAAWRARGLDLDAPYWLGAVAAGRRAAGRLDDARSTLEEALALVERQGERVHEAELYRLRGEIRAEHDGIGALADLERALRVAREQGARLFELRAARSLERLGPTGRQGEVIRAGDEIRTVSEPATP